MKMAGKKANLMPPSAEVESPAEDKGENESTESKTTKKTGSFQGKSNAPGGGGRFAQMKAKGVSSGLAAFIGRQKFGAKRMAQMSAAGKSGK